ncbi:PIH1 domain-containing protein 1-like [Branchiostoma floridae]|uniref:PIH1 domain-containing protein 1 n=1 Tax=Branchiostoma floridae TaxID=7739 RepID=A0A9J7HNW0_BRAFL|nr:PIH1 domain-containing protein 1-like [Branchiostoma floridae]
MAESDSSLLNLDDEDLYKRLLLESLEKEGAAGLGGLQPQEPLGRRVVPKPGFCVKTKADNEQKVFINVCTAEEVPEPRDINEEELREILESEDAGKYRVSMSIGEPHTEVDKGGKGCTAYDVIVNPNFYDKMQKQDIFKAFFLVVCLEGLEQKYQMLLSRNYTILKNRRCLGALQEQFLRTKSKPFIHEMDRDKSSSLISEVESTETRIPEPEYTIIKEPADGYPEFLVAEFKLPAVRSVKFLTLDVGEDRIVLGARPDLYHLDIFLPYNINREESGAQFNKKTRTLTLTMPVQPAS